MQTNRVLLAHSDSAVQELAERALARIGVPLDIASDSVDALARVARQPYAVVALERDDAVLAAVAATFADTRPVVIVSAEDSAGLDADIVSLVVPHPYDAHTLVGVILACVTPGSAPFEDAPPAELADNL